MKTARFDAFAASLEVIRERHPNVTAVLVYRLQDGQWYDKQGRLAIPSSVRAFARAIDKGLPVRVGGSTALVIPHQELNAVVEVALEKIPRKSTQFAITKTVAEIAETSGHRFDATHDSLTGCLNRRSFDSDIATVIQSQSAEVQDPIADDFSQSLGVIALLSLDIDFFKRINDSYGHAFGDVVLAAFSWQVESTLDRLRALHPASSYQLYRLGGEEFNIVASNVTSDQAMTAAEHVRSDIEAALPLPSDKQFDVICTSLGLECARPPMGERSVRTSVGLAVYERQSGKVMANKEAGRLKLQADRALTSAKRGGRNQVRFFPDIARNHGRVLEVDDDAGVVVIDVGSEVGVRFGDEFFVIPERYSGTFPLLLDDGRSQRAIGKYPRIRVAKIAVFDVQMDVSFCKVNELEVGAKIRAGALLEGIPVGHFRGLSSLGSKPVLDGYSEATAALRRRGEEIGPEHLAMIAVRLNSIDALEREQGGAAVNRLLSSIHQKITSVMPPSSIIAHADLGTFGAAFSYNDATMVRELANRLMVELEPTVPPDVRFSVGFYLGNAKDRAQVKGDQSVLRPEYAFEYALIAATANSQGCSEYTPGSAQRVMASAVSAGNRQGALADYSRFRTMGIHSANVENAAGIAAATREMLAEADAYFRSAIELNPDSSASKANMALIRTYQGRYVEAAQLFDLASSELTKGMPLSLLRPYALSKLKVLPLLDGELHGEAVEQVLILLNRATVTEDRFDVSDAALVLAASEAGVDWKKASA